LKTVTFKELQEWTRKIWTEGFGEALVQVKSSKKQGNNLFFEDFYTLLDTFEELQEWTRKIWTEGFGEALLQVRVPASILKGLLPESYIDAEGTPTKSHISPSILVYEVKSGRSGPARYGPRALAKPSSR